MCSEVGSNAYDRDTGSEDQSAHWADSQMIHICCSYSVVEEKSLYYVKIDTFVNATFKRLRWLTLLNAMF